MSTQQAIIFGASGLVGSKLLNSLVQEQSYSKVLAVSRRPLQIDSAQRNNEHYFENIVIDFEALLFPNDSETKHPTNSEKLSQFISLFNANTHVYLCLGTTIKEAQSKAAFKRIDFAYTTQIAEIAKAQGVQYLAVVSAIGATPSQKRSHFFYTEVKATTEAYLEQLKFKHLIIAQPSLLLGKRKHFRLGEYIAQKTLPIVATLFPSALAKYRPITANCVAHAMYKAMHQASAINLPTPRIQRLTYLDFIAS